MSYTKNSPSMCVWKMCAMCSIQWYTHSRRRYCVQTIRAILQSQTFVSVSTKWNKFIFGHRRWDTISVNFIFHYCRPDNIVWIWHTLCWWGTDAMPCRALYGRGVRSSCVSVEVAAASTDHCMSARRIIVGKEITQHNTLFQLRVFLRLSTFILEAFFFLYNRKIFIDQLLNYKFLYFNLMYGIQSTRVIAIFSILRMWAELGKVEN